MSLGTLVHVVQTPGDPQASNIMPKTLRHGEAASNKRAGMFSAVCLSCISHPGAHGGKLNELCSTSHLNVKCGGKVFNQKGKCSVI